MLRGWIKGLSVLYGSYSIVSTAVMSIQQAHFDPPPHTLYNKLAITW